MTWEIIKLAKFVFFLLALVPAMMAAVIVTARWVNIPIWDEWDTPGATLLNFVNGNLSWGDLYFQHNESRKLVPRLISMALTWIMGWDLRQGMALAFLSACSASALVLGHLRRHAVTDGGPVLASWLVVNLMLFAPSAYENFLSSNAYEIYLPVLCAFGAVAVNLSGWPLAAKTLICALLASIGTYTFAHGMLLWVLAIPLPNLGGAPARSRLYSILCYGAYAALAIASVGFYFVGYVRPEIAPPSATLAQLPDLLHFMAMWLGGPLRSLAVDPRIPGGILGLLVAAVALVVPFVLRRRPTLWRRYYPWAFIGCFALASGVLTAAGRLNLGMDAVFNRDFDGFSSVKYNVIAVFVYLAVIGAMTGLYYDCLRDRAELRVHLCVGLAVCLTLLGVAWLYAYSEEQNRLEAFQANRRQALLAVTWMDAIPDNPSILVAYPFPEEGFRERVPAMQQAGLIRLPAISDKIKRTIATLPESASLAGGAIDSGRREAQGRFRIAGWARSAVRNARAEHVVIGWEGSDRSFHPFTVLSTGIKRPDLIPVFKTEAMMHAGFNEVIDVSKIPESAVSLRAWAVDIKEQQAFALTGSAPLKNPYP